MPILGWNFGCIIMVLLAYLIREWSYLQLSFAVASLGLSVIYFLVPESPRWLLEKGQFNQVHTQLFNPVSEQIVAWLLKEPC